MYSLNKVSFIGHVGKDPNIHDTQDGKTLASFSLATSESWIDKNTNERIEKTEWHNIVAFDTNIVKLVGKYLKKGSKLYIEGTLKTRKWMDKSNNERYTTEVVLQQYKSALIILSGVTDVTQHDVNDALAEQDDDEIPF